LAAWSVSFSGSNGSNNHLVRPLAENPEGLLMPAGCYQTGDAVEVRTGSYADRRGTVLERAVDDDAVPRRILYLVQFPDHDPARWFVAGRLRKPR
jgi:hypothetical protein